MCSQVSTMGAAISPSTYPSNNSLEHGILAGSYFVFLEQEVIILNGKQVSVLVLKYRSTVIVIVMLILAYLLTRLKTQCTKHD